MGMKRFLISASLAALLGCAGAPESAGERHILGPFAHENLAVFLIAKPGAKGSGAAYLTLEEALKSGGLRVTEKADGAEVNELEVENVGERPVYLQAGDTVKGGQQDRTIAVDLLLTPKSGKTKVDAYCVEPGRWETRAGGGPLAGATFSLAEAPASTTKQKLAIKEAKSQDEVWKAGREANGKLARNSGALQVQDSFVLAAEDPEVKKRTDATVRALGRAIEGRDDLVGLAFAINGEPLGAEIYADPTLFRVLWPKLLKAAAVEALEKRADAKTGREATRSDIAALLQDASKGEERVEPVAKDVRVRSRKGTSASCFDTEKDGELLHRQVLKR